MKVKILFVSYCHSCDVTFISVEKIGDISEALSVFYVRRYAVAVSTIAVLLFLSIPADCPSTHRTPQAHRLWKWDGQSQLHPISRDVSCRFVAAITQQKALKLYVSPSTGSGTEPLYKVPFSVTRWQWKLLMRALFWSLRPHSQGGLQSNCWSSFTLPILSNPPPRHKMPFLCHVMERIAVGIKVVLLNVPSVL